MKVFMFGFVPPQDPEASEERIFPAHLALDVIAARRFGEVRRRFGLSQADVARAAEEVGLDWSRSQVHAIERFGYGGKVPERRPRRGGGDASPPPRSPNPQSGTRRLTLMELFVFPRIVELACKHRGIPYEPIHPAWFLPKEAYDGLRGALTDPRRELTTWSETPSGT